MSDQPEDLPRAEEVLKRWGEFHHPRTLTVTVELPDEDWAAIARMTKGEKVGEFVANAIQAFIDQILSGDDDGEPES